MPSERVQRQIDLLLEQAEGGLAKQDWKAVRGAALAVLAVDAGNADASAFLAMAEKAAGDIGAGGDGGTGEAPATSRPIKAEKQPSSFASGRYTVKEFLGEGGKKRVYLARDTVLDRDVAFALIKTEGLDETSRQRITREAQAMGRLGDHPNIVPIFDLGQEKDPTTGAPQPFMVLPLMQGGDVEAEIEKAPDHRIPLERVLQIAKDTCEGLVFAHSKGIVHRDLKPGNVWLTERGAARIGDFGLAVATDRSRLTRERMMVGTVAYMPPEQAMGGDITPRADLYSLGAMLYEMVTGRPPFLGDDDIAIIGQHINTPPVAPSWHNPRCPKPLEALIMRLLSKDPAQRPESAKDVLSALGAIDPATLTDASAGDGAGKISSEGTLGQLQKAHRLLDSLSSGVFVGRHREMDQLKAALEDALSARGRMLTLVGEPGIGKSRTSLELATYAALRNCQVLWGRCYEGTGAPPYWPWVQAIRSYVQQREPEDLRREMGSTASVIAEVVADVKERLPELQPPKTLEDPESARFRLFDSIATFLKNASRTRPILLILDDLHWSDKPSLMLLEFFVRELTGSRILLLGTYRDVELNRRHPLSMTLGDLTKERLFERVILRGLTRTDVARFIELAAGTKAPDPLVDTVFRHTEGNPLFVTEIVRLLVQEGEFSRARAEAAGRGRRTTSWEIRIPEGVKEVIGRRLDRLSERCNEVLTVAAVVGRQFRLDVLKKLLDDMTEDRLLDVLDEVLNARIIEELPSEIGLYQFTHALLQETLLEELSLTRRVRVHARIATALEGVYGDRAEENAAELVHHFEQAQTILGVAKVATYSLAAGNRSLAAYGFEEARVHFERGIAAKGTSRDREYAYLVAGLARALARTSERSEMQDVVDRMTEAFDLLTGLGEVQAALEVVTLDISSAQGIVGIEALLQRALPLAEEGSPDRVRVLAGLSKWNSLETYNSEKAREFAEEAIRVSGEIGDPALRLRVFGSIHDSSFYARFDDSQMKAQAERGEAAGYVCEYLEHVGYHLWGVGRLADAESVLGTQLRVAERARHRWQRAAAIGNLGSFEVEQGHWERAAQLLDEGLVLAPDEGRLTGPRIEVAVQTADLPAAVSMIERVTPGWVELARRNRAFRATLVVGFIGWWSYALDRDLIPDELLTLTQQSAGDEASYGPGGVAFADLALRGLAVAWTMREDRSRLRQVYDRLLEYKAKSERPSVRSFGISRRDLALARAAAKLGLFDDAKEHFASVMTCFGQPAAAQWLRAWVLHDIAEMLFERDGAGNRQEATKINDEAVDLAKRYGLKLLLERLLKRRQFLRA